MYVFIATCNSVLVMSKFMDSELLVIAYVPDLAQHANSVYIAIHRVGVW